MSAVTIGPFAFSAERLSVLLGLLAFMLVAGVLAGRVDKRFGPWTTVVVLAALAAARLGHVVEYWESFAAEPLRAFAIWQGGVSWPWAIGPFVLATVLMLRRPRLIGLSLAAFASAALVWTTTHQLTANTPPTPLPPIQAEHIDGRVIDLTAKDGRPIVMNVWATWCPPCRREMPLLAAAARANPDVRFVFVNQGESLERVRGYLERERLRIDDIVFDSAMAVPRHYETAGVPVTLFISPEGTLRDAHMGEISPETLTEKLKSLPRRP